jgi:hypothetical protein
LTLRESVGRLLIHDRSTYSAGFIDKILTQESKSWPSKISPCGNNLPF